MRPPKAAIVVDTSVLIACSRGRSTGALLAASDRCALVVTDRTIAEARRRIEFGLRTPEIMPVLDGLLDGISVVFASEIGHDIARAETVLRDAVASRNGSTSDAHVLACAWVLDADIWSFDRDFAGTGVASWSTANLMRALAEHAISR